MAPHQDGVVASIDQQQPMIVGAFTGDEREVVKAYERAVFNVLFNNRDDQLKNFAFRLDRDRRWRLAPAYDLTFSMGPGGEHQMDVCGEARRITRAHVLELAAKGGIRTRAATATLERMLEQVPSLERRLKDRSVRITTIRAVVQAVNANSLELGRSS
jgi:serine/threonine-protein kinase HipA